LLSDYAWIDLIKSNARCCFGLEIVERSNVGASGLALGVRQVLRTIVPSSSKSVEKLCVGVPSSSWRLVALILAASLNHRQPFAMLTQDLLGHETTVTRNEVLAHPSSPRLQECFGSGEAPSGRASPRPPAAASAAASPTTAGADDRSWRDPSQRTTAHSA
jgi:hypothetical protein